MQLRSCPDRKSRRKRCSIFLDSGLLHTWFRRLHIRWSFSFIAYERHAESYFRSVGWRSHIIAWNSIYQSLKIWDNITKPFLQVRNKNSYGRVNFNLRILVLTNTRNKSLAEGKASQKPSRSTGFFVNSLISLIEYTILTCDSQETMTTFHKFQS